jgi:hypothetical protein
MRYAVLSVGLGLCACVPAAEEGAAPSDYIEVSQGGAFGGGYGYTVYADDTIVAESWEPFSDSTLTPRTPIEAGAYARLRAAAEANWQAAAEGLSGEACPDYGTDLVEVSPPIRGQSVLLAGCPDDDLSTLITAINLARSGA